MNNVEYTFCELREREVVNVADGKKLGRINDIAFSEKGQIIGLIVPGERKLIKNITGVDSLFVPFRNVLKIGNDVILVDLSNDPPPPPPPPRISPCC